MKEREKGKSKMATSLHPNLRKALQYIGVDDPQVVCTMSVDQESDSTPRMEDFLVEGERDGKSVRGWLLHDEPIAKTKWYECQSDGSWPFEVR